MSLREEIDDMKRVQNDIREVLKLADQKKTRKQYKIPWIVRAGYKRKQKKGEILVLHMQNNHNADFKWVKEEGGNILINGTPHRFDNTAIYNVGNIPLMPIFEWRLEPAGGTTDKQKAEDAGGTTFSGKTVIRAIESAELAKVEGKKKKGKGGLLLLIIGVIVVIYLISQGLLG